MTRKSILTIAALILIILAIIIIFAGVSGDRILLPPVITGVGFAVIAWVFLSFRKDPNE